MIEKEINQIKTQNDHCKTCLTNEEYDYELIIIGGGAGGFSAATKASELGIKTLMINGGLPIGGTCVNVGCVPSKILIEMSNDYYYTTKSTYDALTGSCNTEFNFKTAIDEKHKLVSGLRKSNYIDVSTTFKGVEIIEGRGKFISPNEIKVNKNIYSAKNFIIATGSRPKIIPFKGIDKVPYITNRELLSIEELPKKLIVIGAGPIGLELAQAFTHFGSKVIVLEKESQILPRIDREIANELQKNLEDEGIQIKLNVNIEELSKDNGDKIVSTTIDYKKALFIGDEILISIGVTPNSDCLDLEKGGAKVGKGGFIEVNKELQTSQPHIYAVGDVVGNAFLETVAAKEGYIAASNLFQGTHKSINYEAVPQAIFTSPQVAVVGLSEDEFIKKYGSCNCRTIDVATIPKAQALKETRGMIKMLVHPETDLILGVSIVSPMAADLIHEATLAVKFKMTVDDIIDTVHVFPTISEGIKRVAQAFKRDITIMSCCVE